MELKKHVFLIGNSVTSSISFETFKEKKIYIQNAIESLIISIVHENISSNELILAKFIT